MTIALRTFPKKNASPIFGGFSERNFTCTGFVVNSIPKYEMLVCIQFCDKVGITKKNEFKI